MVVSEAAREVVEHALLELVHALQEAPGGKGDDDPDDRREGEKGEELLGRDRRALVRRHGGGLSHLADPIAQAASASVSPPGSIRPATRA